VGGLVSVDAALYKKILGLLLLIPVIRFLFFSNVPDAQLKPANTPIALMLGAGIGLLSGLIGIGGGIILSPVLLMLRWTNQKQTAAVSALFIFVNSLSGLGGQISRGVQFSPEMLLYVALAFAGGMLGAYLGAIRFNQNILKFSLVLVLGVAAFKLLFTAA
jgi:uncharacterized membrane protein YfcA